MKAVPSQYQTVRNIRSAAILLTLLVGIFAVGSSWLSLREEQTRQVKSLTALAEITAKSMDEYLLGLQSAMNLTAPGALDEQGQYDPARADATVRRLKAAYPELRIVTLARLDGSIIASTEKIVPNSSPTLAAQRSFVAAREERLRTGNRALTIGRAFFGPISREWIMPLGSGVWDKDGQLKLILGAGLPLAKPQGVWVDAPLPEGAAMGLRRDDGYIQLRYPNPPGTELGSVYNKRATGPLGDYLDKHNYPQRGTVSGNSGVTGNATVFVFRRLAHFPLTFFVADPRSSVLTAWWERVWPTFLLWLLLMLAGSYVYQWALRRQLDWEVEKARQIRMLEAANQELEDFAYTVAHDLKAPVRAIDGHAGIAMEGFGAGMPEGLRHRMLQIRRSALRMAELIDDLLEFSRYSRSALNTRQVDMEKLAREVATDLVPADAGVSLAIGTLPACNADPGLMRVVWTALLSNAVKYSAGVDGPEIEVGFADGHYFVRDNGVGFDMAHYRKLFSVFSRLHGVDEFEGTGAGLAIARRVLERQGGTITAESRPGHGAIFRFTVPAAAEVSGNDN